MPGAAREIWRRLGIDADPGADGVAAVVGGSLEWGGYPGGLPVEKGLPLFPRRKGGAGE